MNTFQDPHIIALYRKIHENPEYLDVPNDMTFVESPLHTAASEGRTGLALEILRLKPSLGKKLNLDGLSPLHLALGNGHTNTVRRLVKHDPELIRVPVREGITLLHYAVEKEEIDLLIYFLLICPLSINDLTVRDETVVHIAVRNENLRAFKVLFSWARKTNNTTVFRWRNEEGNNLMHLAALTNQTEVIKSLIGYVYVNKKNLEGKTALDILEPENVEERKILISAGAKEGSSLVDDATSCENYLKSNRTVEDFFVKFGAYMEYGLSGSMRNAILVVVTLIATSRFQDVITTPTSTNSVITDFKNMVEREKLDRIYNSVACGLAMGTCAILILDRLQKLYLVHLALFYVSYAALSYVIYPGQFFYSLAASLISLPILMILRWKIILMRGQIRGDIYHEYNLDEVKFLIFGSTFTNQGPVVTWMAERKASR